MVAEFVCGERQRCRAEGEGSGFGARPPAPRALSVTVWAPPGLYRACGGVRSNVMLFALAGTGKSLVWTGKKNKNSVSFPVILVRYEWYR